MSNQPINVTAPDSTQNGAMASLPGKNRAMPIAILVGAAICLFAFFTQLAVNTSSQSLQGLTTEPTYQIANLILYGARLTVVLGIGALFSTFISSTGYSRRLLSLLTLIAVLMIGIGTVGAVWQYSREYLSAFGGFKRIDIGSIITQNLRLGLHLPLLGAVVMLTSDRMGRVKRAPKAAVQT